MIIYYTYLLMVGLIQLSPYKDSDLLESNTERKACEILFNEIFVDTNGSLKSNEFVDEMYREIIDDFIIEVESSGKNIFYDGYSCNISYPYLDSTDIVFMKNKGLLTDGEESEIHQLYSDYNHKVNEPKDTVQICDIDGFIKVPKSTFKDEYEKLGYFFELNKYIRSDNKIYVQAHFTSSDRILEIYLVFDASNKEYKHFFVNKY